MNHKTIFQCVRFWLIWNIGFCSAVLFAQTEGNSDRRPNVVIIVTDDGGWADFGFNGCKDYPTPNLDRIAKEGANFTAGYVSGCVCSPSRAGMLTSRFGGRFGHDMNIGNNQKQGLPLSEKLLSDRFQALGYTTGALGKWHLGAAPGHRPEDRGFDETYGFYSGGRSYYPDKKLNDGMNTWRRNGTPVLEKEYVTDAIAREACSYIERHRDKPFFLYAAFTCPHSPMEAKEGYEDKYAHIVDKRRRRIAAMMQSQDEATGRILASIKEQGLDDNTIVWLINDNGGASYSKFDNGPWRGTKGMLFEGGVRVAFAVRWPGTIPPGQTIGQTVSALDIGVTSLAAAGAPEMPELDGKDLRPLLQGKTTASPHENLFWRFPPATAVRHGDWKLICVDSRPIHIYNLASDPSEKNNLIDDPSAPRAELIKILRDWEKSLPAPLWVEGNNWIELHRKHHLEK
jgi:arylsulfatase A-like enzyme